MLEYMYKHGGSPDIYIEGSGMSYTDSYIKRDDTGDNFLQGSLPKSLRFLEQSLEGTWHEFDVILVSGYSGAIPGAILAHKYNKQLVIVRKDEDVCHGVRTEGRDYWAVGTPYIILDDMISSGRTMNRMLDKARELGHDPPRYLVLYRGTCVWANGDICWDERIVHFDHVQHNLYSIRVEKEKVIRMGEV